MPEITRKLAERVAKHNWEARIARQAREEPGTLYVQWVDLTIPGRMGLISDMQYALEQVFDNDT